MKYECKVEVEISESSVKDKAIHQAIRDYYMGLMVIAMKDLNHTDKDIADILYEIDYESRKDNDVYGTIEYFQKWEKEHLK